MPDPVGFEYVFVKKKNEQINEVKVIYIFFVFITHLNLEARPTEEGMMIRENGKQVNSIVVIKFYK